MSRETIGFRIACIAALLFVLPQLARAQDPPPPPPPQSDALFNSAVVQRIDLWVNELDWEKLKASFQENTYYPADLVFNGQTASNVGIRSRGRGSRSPTKPGLRVDMDRYTLDQTFLGLKSFVLDNLTQDPSAIHETVTMKLFARLGIPAPREAHVRLYVNNQYAGLYAVVESIDKSFLARIFGVIGEDTQNDGYLYEFDYTDEWKFGYLGSELEPYKQRFDPKTHESKSDVEKYGPIENVVRLINELPSDQFMSQLNTHLDLHAFMRYVAAQNFVGQNDGFLGYAGVNNFYFYRKENLPTHVLLAWDEDNAFWGPNFPVNMRHDDNVLMNKAMQVPELQNTYYQVLADAVTSAYEVQPDGMPWLESEIRRQTDLIYDALAADTNKPYTIDDHANARVHMLLFAQGRGNYVQGEVSVVQNQSSAAQRRRPE
jgi:spore coat protein CotH